MIKPINIKIYKNLQNIDKITNREINQNRLELAINVQTYRVLLVAQFSFCKTQKYNPKVVL